ncbi:MAG: glycogen synthase, partial [Bifidobacterium crudilactis]|nr:glycogen synthase [Bifidobacterium crudilactis]
MKVDILSREYPPHVYGGAGVHVEELSKVLAERIDVTVRAFDGPRGGVYDSHGSGHGLEVVGYDVPAEL